ncbi:MAG: ABC-type nitrate/sulfonate/bicarbonate transport system, periplasmic component [Deltaproteobacteria bacterium]|nr:ABC-type nitrate/sulfonate/bicarbonate transport system, periplasmic component [Deltaproteobacteria bacterium]
MVLAFDAGFVFAQEGRRLRAGYASLSGNMAPYWAAKEAGLFRKYGLDIDLVAFPSGTGGMAAMIAGEIEFLAIAGSTTASAAIGGADVVSLAITTERLVTSLMAIPSVPRGEDLKGTASPTYLDFSDDEKRGKDCISRKERQGRQDIIYKNRGHGRGLCELSVLGAITFLALILFNISKVRIYWH